MNINNFKSREDKNKVIVQSLFNVISLLGNDGDLAQSFLKQIQSEHRTNIQSFFRMIQEVIIEYAKSEYFDDRNKASIEWAKKVAKLEDHLPLI